MDVVNLKRGLNSGSFAVASSIQPIELRARKRSKSPDSRPIHKFEITPNLCASGHTRFDDCENSHSAQQTRNEINHSRRMSICSESTDLLIFARRTLLRKFSLPELFGRTLLGETANSNCEVSDEVNRPYLPLSLLDRPENDFTFPDPLTRKVSAVIPAPIRTFAKQDSSQQRRPCVRPSSTCRKAAAIPFAPA